MNKKEELSNECSAVIFHTRNAEEELFDLFIQQV
jgi:hypothetical protein